MRVVDLFSGCGGMSFGFEKSDFSIVGAFEYWPIAVSCYKQNFNHPIWQMDLSQIEPAVEAIRPLKPDVIIGGPPCQDFSHAGKRVEAGRASLTCSFAQIVCAVLPKYFVMENVDRSQKSLAYANAREIFIEAGYGLTEICLDASLCGVPQKRKRFFCIGALGESHEFMLNMIQQRISPKETTLRDYFGETLDFEFYYRHPRNYSRRAIFSIDEPAPTMRGVNRPVPKGYPGHPNDPCKLNENVRALTTLERALIQTFPANYKWCGNKTDMEQMIGNAVPVDLARFVADALRDYIKQSGRPSIVSDNLVVWLTNTEGISPKSARDVASRLKRADKICEITQIPDAYYLYQLGQSAEFGALSVNVQSQIKRAVKLYAQYLNVVHNVSSSAV